MSATTDIREEEAANLDEMAKHSYKKAFIRDCRGDQVGAAFWRGRARGLELAAINLRLPPLPDAISLGSFLGERGRS